MNDALTSLPLLTCPSAVRELTNQGIERAGAVAMEFVNMANYKNLVIKPDFLRTFRFRVPFQDPIHSKPYRLITKMLYNSQPLT